MTDPGRVISFTLSKPVMHAFGMFDRTVNVSDYPGMVAEYLPERHCIQVSWPGRPDRPTAICIHVTKVDSWQEVLKETLKGTPCKCGPDRHKTNEAALKCPNK